MNRSYQTAHPLNGNNTKSEIEFGYNHVNVNEARVIYPGCWKLTIRLKINWLFFYLPTKLR